MNTRKKDYYQILEQQKVLMDLDKEYVIKVINGNYQLISDLFKHSTYRQGTYTSKELQFIKSVRTHILKNDIHLKEEFQERQLYSDDVHYVKVARVPIGEVFDKVCEVDIDQAYWETAYQLGIVNDTIYSTGCKGVISKKARLTALGSLAKKTYIYKFKGKKVIGKEVEKDPLLENLWFTICKRVSDVMHSVIDSLGKDFIFYWVDGIYFKHTKKNVQIAMNTFIENGYNAKFKKINQIYFHDTGFVVNDYGEIKREFNFPDYSLAKKKTDYSEAFRLSNLANDIINSKIDLLDDINNDRFD